MLCDRILLPKSNDESDDDGNKKCIGMIWKITKIEFLRKISSSMCLKSRDSRHRLTHTRLLNMILHAFSFGELILVPSKEGYIWRVEAGFQELYIVADLCTCALKQEIHFEFP